MPAFPGPAGAARDRLSGRVHVLEDHPDEVFRQVSAWIAPRLVLEAQAELLVERRLAEAERARNPAPARDIRRPASRVLHAVEMHARGPNGGSQGGRLYSKPDVGGAPLAQLTRRPG